MIFCSTYDFLLHLSICWTKLHYNYKNQHRSTKLKGPHIISGFRLVGKVFSCEVLFGLFLINHYFVMKLHSGSTYNREISIFNFSVVFLKNTFILYHHFYGLSIVFTNIYKSVQTYLLFHFPSFLLLSHIYHK